MTISINLAMACGMQSLLYAKGWFGTAGGRFTPLYNHAFASLFSKSHRADMYSQHRDQCPPPPQPHFPFTVMNDDL
jgi:hypothetical protein